MAFLYAGTVNFLYDRQLNGSTLPQGYHIHIAAVKTGQGATAFSTLPFPDFIYHPAPVPVGTGRCPAQDAHPHRY